MKTKIVQIQGELIDLSKIYRIGAIESDGMSSFPGFKIYFLNKNVLDINVSTEYIDHYQNIEKNYASNLMFSSNYESYKIFWKNVVDNWNKEIKRIHEELFKLWSENDSELIKLEINFLEFNLNQ